MRCSLRPRKELQNKKRHYALDWNLCSIVLACSACSERINLHLRFGNLPLLIGITVGVFIAVIKLLTSPPRARPDRLPISAYPHLVASSFSCGVLLAQRDTPDAIVRPMLPMFSFSGRGSNVLSIITSRTSCGDESRSGEPT